MSQSKITPSHFLPAYLKLDAGLGTSVQMPFLTALDAFVRGLNHELSQRNLAADPHHHPTQLQKESLARMGVETHRLDQKGIARLFEAREELSASALGAIELLASVYYPEASLSRVRSLSKSQGPRIRILDALESDHTVFVYALEEKKGRSEEFLKNCRSLLPLKYEVKLVFPHQEQTEKPNFRLKAVKLQERRLPCPISQK